MRAPKAAGKPKKASLAEVDVDSFLELDDAVLAAEAAPAGRKQRAAGAAAAEKASTAKGHKSELEALKKKARGAAATSRAAAG